MKDDERFLREKLGALDPQRHAWIAIRCVDRVGPRLTYFFGGTFRLPEARGLLAAVACKQAPDLAKTETLREFYEAKVGELYGDDEQGYPLDAVKVICGALAIAAPRDWDAPGDVALFVVEAVDFRIEHTGSG